MDNDFERYQCQIALPGFGIVSQDLLKNAKVLMIGMGGLGCPCAQYLVSSGIGTIAMADDDTVTTGNLHRQILFGPEDVGRFKVDIAAKKLQQQNPSVNIIPLNLRVTSENVLDLLSEFDLIIEGTDNFETKYLLNDACVLMGKPLVYGAIYRYEGQVSLFNVLQEDGAHTPNYRDVFPDIEESQIPNCREGGVIPTLAGIIGCMQANEAIKYLMGSKDILSGKLWMINVINGKTQTIKLKKNPTVQITEIIRTIPEISCQQLMSDKKSFEIIDVRSEVEHMDFNIGGINIPLDRLQDQLTLISSIRQPMVIYCQSGRRSMIAARKIKKAFPQKEVRSLKGGLNAAVQQ